MRKLMLLAAASALMGGSALAETQAVKVDAGRTDFADRAQVRQLYARLTTAALRVCQTEDDKLYGAKPDKACVDATVAEAVKHVDQPRLTAMLPGSRATLTATDDR